MQQRKAKGKTTSGKMVIHKTSLFVVLLVTVSLLAGVVPAQAAVKWKFSTSDGKKKAAVNAAITLEKQEFCDMNLYRNGKVIKESDATPAVTVILIPTGSEASYTAKDSTGTLDMTVKPGFVSTITRRTKYVGEIEQAEVICCPFGKL